LLTNQATSQHVIDTLTGWAKLMKAGDILFISYSGHGGSIRDESGDEDDWVDETWCLYDRQLIDDELNNLLALFESGVRILVISDSCHSGTVTKDNYERRWAHDLPSPDANLVKKRMPSFVADFIYKSNRSLYDQIPKNLPDPNISLEDLSASVILLSGCQDDQSSYILDMESIKYSVFTQGINRVLKKGKEIKNYKSFYEAIDKELKGFKKQRPNYFLSGAKDKDFEAQRPFTV
jgi:hypothetical protein